MNTSIEKLLPHIKALIIFIILTVATIQFQTDWFYHIQFWSTWYPAIWFPNDSDITLSLALYWIFFLSSYLLYALAGLGLARYFSACRFFIWLNITACIIAGLVQKYVYSMTYDAERLGILLIFVVLLVASKTAWFPKTT